MRGWFVRGDVDGFFGLALDNLVQLLLIGTLCGVVLGFPADLVYGRILPGAAVSILVGNLFYAWQARELARKTGRTDVCALPYGINTVSLFAHVFLVMAPAKAIATQAGLADPSRIAWQAGLLACFGSGAIELVLAFVAEPIRRATPRAALLSTLAGIALGFISLGFLFRTFAHPIVGLATLGVVMLTYFGRVRFKGRIPGGMVAVGVGVALAWATHLAPFGPTPAGGVSFHLPIPVPGDLLAAVTGGQLIPYLSVIVPMGLFNVLGSLQNIESAEAAGDAYDTRRSLIVNGVGSIVASLFGSCFPTTIYIGHPGWKGLGARSGYSILNGAFITIVCLTGTVAWMLWAVPVDAGMAIVLWIGLVISAQAFQATPKEHAPAVVVGLLPGIAAWGVLLAKQALAASGVGWTDELLDRLASFDSWMRGGLALEQGFIFSSMILAAATAAVIDRRFRAASLWCALGAAFCAIGLMHSYSIAGGTPVMKLAPAWPWAIGYLTMAAIFLVAPLVTEPGGEH